MSSGNWYNNDGLPIQFGTSKTTAEVAGEYLSLGSNRIVEATINLASLTTSGPTVVSYTELFPGASNIYIEKVEILPEVAMSTTGSPTISVGLGSGNPFSGTTSISDTAFVNALSSSSLSTAGELVTLYVGQTGVGAYVGDYNAATSFASGYITAKLGTTTATGTVKCRIFYHGVGTISN